MNPIDLAIAAGELPPCEREWKFHPDRRWKMDLAWVPEMICLEIEGGAYIQGRHLRPKGFTNDCEKYSTAAAMGWLVIRATTEQVESGMALTWLKQALALRGKV